MFTSWTAKAKSASDDSEHIDEVTTELAKQHAEAKRMREKYPDRIPLILKARQGAKDSIPPLDKEKYLFPSEFFWHQFLTFIRRRMVLKPEQSLFIFVNNALPSMNDTIGQIDAAVGDQNGFLSCVYGAENTFGGERTGDSGCL